MNSSRYIKFIPILIATFFVYLFVIIKSNEANKTMMYHIDMGNAIKFSFNFEQGDSALSYSPSTLKVFGGKYSSALPSNMEFGPTLHLKNINYAPEIAGVQVSIMAFTDDNTNDVDFVLSLDNGKDALFWESKNLSKQEKNGSWEMAKCTFDTEKFSSITEGNLNLKVYLLNKGQQLYLDNFEIQMLLK